MRGGRVRISGALGNLGEGWDESAPEASEASQVSCHTVVTGGHGWLRGFHQATGVEQDAAVV
jgi:hypothetical protein